ncbi:hypothetical protein EX30DRAFT_96414 [Ascodesmis nigricans]|uniref:Pentatricopeptide repeat protein n=1 Tax=Ascodesmis nigricans TaxID=341454 RepID=A0A4S2N421_9PEZI|nr:hypothetical protein EX30DRAFT_96414 [Ascodesmis nigricans]
MATESMLICWIEGQSEDLDQHPYIPVEWRLAKPLSIRREDLSHDDRRRQGKESSVGDPFLSSDPIPERPIWCDEDDVRGPPHPTRSSKHFTQKEVEAIHIAMDARKAKIEAEDQALDRCVGQHGDRMTTYLYPYVAPAVQAMERGIKELEDEITLLEIELERYRHHRAAVRWLLSRGRSAEAVFQQAQFLPDPLPLTYVEEVLGYVAVRRRAFRLSVVLLEALASRARSHELGAIFSFLVLERLGPMLTSAKSSTQPAVEKLSLKFTELLNRITAVRGAGRRIVLSKEAIRVLVDAAPAATLSELYTALVLAHGGEYKAAISVYEVLRVIARLCRPESGESKWHAAFAVLQTLDGDRLLYKRYSRHVMYIVLQTALTNSSKDEKDMVAEILSFIARNSPANWSPDRVLLHHRMSKALAELDGAVLESHFKEFVDSGKTPDMVTLNILHNYYKRIGDEGSRQAIVAEAFAITRPSVEFATDILHALVLSHEPFEAVFREYRQHFLTADLSHFGIIAHIPSILPESEQETLGLYKPDDVTIAVMIQSYINNTHSIQAIWHVYSSYQRLLTGRHAATRYHAIRKTLMKSGPYIPHMIMLALSRYRRGLPYIANILEDLMRPGAPLKADVYSWSIFLRGLTLHGKQDEAELVLKMMQQRNLSPNVVTWTTLLVGYVHSADHDAVERVLQAMMDNGVTPNTQTWAAVIKSCFMEEDGTGDWRAGDAFRRMLDMGIVPDKHVHDALEGVRDRYAFEAGLSGERMEGDSVFEEGELSYPEVRVRDNVRAFAGGRGSEDLKEVFNIEEDPLKSRIRERDEEDQVVEGMLHAAEQKPVVQVMDFSIADEEAMRQEEELKMELEREKKRIAEERRRITESMFEEGDLTWAEAKGAGVDAEERREGVDMAGGKERS